MKKASILAGIVLIVLVVGLLRGQAPTSGNQVRKIVVGGTGDSQEVLRKVAVALEKKVPDTLIEVPDAVGSMGGIKALLAGKIDLARVARPLKSEEKEQGLNYMLFARSPAVCVVHPSVTDVNNITSEQVVGIYSGRITDWTQLGSATSGKVYAIAREKGDSVFDVLNKFIPGLREISEPVAHVAFTTPEAVATLVKHKGTIGFLPLSAAVGTPLRILAFEGIKVTPEAVTGGQYKLVVPYGIVYKETLEGLSKQFVDFLFCPEGRQILTGMGAIPVAGQDPNQSTPKPDSARS
jgi:phosphate transport system substrate-binding protein